MKYEEIKREFSETFIKKVVYSPTANYVFTYLLENNNPNLYKVIEQLVEVIDDSHQVSQKPQPFVIDYESLPEELKAQLREKVFGKEKF